MIGRRLLGVLSPASLHRVSLNTKKSQNAARQVHQSSATKLVDRLQANTPTHAAMWTQLTPWYVGLHGLD